MTTALSRRGTMLAARKLTPAAIALRAAMKRPIKAKRPSAPTVAASWPIVDEVRIALPIPTAANKLTFNIPGKGRGRTAAYNQWIKDAGWIVTTTRPGRIVGRYDLTLRLPDSNISDVDGRTKAALDLFVRLGVTDDDRHCRRSVAEKSDAIPKGTCLVELKSCGAT